MDLWENAKHLKPGETYEQRKEEELKKCQKAKQEILQVLKKYNLFLEG